jgi:aspartyl protease family protein
MFDTRILWLGWTATCMGVVGTLASYQGDHLPGADHEPAPPVAAAAVVAGGLTIPRSADGLFYVTGRANGEEVRFLIDTGSSLVVLTPADAARMGVSGSATRSDLVVRTAAGSVPMEAVRLSRLQVAGQALSGVDAAIADGLGVSLLGQSALARLGTLTLSRDGVTIGEAEPDRTS